MPLCPAGKGHQGQDIRAASCTDNKHWVVAAEAGKITSIGSYSVYVQSGGTTHRYLHMNISGVGLYVGKNVAKGEKIGRVSNEFGGTATTVHLHYDIKQSVSGLGTVYVSPYMSLVESYKDLVGGGGQTGGPEYAAEFVSQTYPYTSVGTVTVKVGQTVTGNFVMKNTGSKTWNSNTKLAPIPRDQPSPLQADSWLSATRISSASKNAKPGETATFQLDFKGKTVGEKIYFLGMVQDGVTWFADGPLGGGPPDNQLAVKVKVVEACTPSCGAKVCGNDGCGGSCGSCGAGLQCTSAGQCACKPQCGGKQCGTDGCGGSCGGCGPDETCSGAGQCQCVPSCAGKVCGDDGCGGSCGGCPAGQACGDNGVCGCAPSCGLNVCGPDGCGGSCGGCGPGFACFDGQCICAPDCLQADGSLKACGPDGCGGFCGFCDNGQSCNPATQQCINDGCQKQCAGKVCGDDGCGGVCGACPDGHTCQDGACACYPECTAKECGDDGCGGSCGTCGEGSVCLASVCLPTDQLGVLVDGGSTTERDGEDDDGLRADGASVSGRDSTGGVGGGGAIPPTDKNSGCSAVPSTGGGHPLPVGALLGLLGVALAFRRRASA
jgi:hypothetical protein